MSEKLDENGKRGIARLKAAWGNSCAGLRDLWKNEEAFRIEIVLLALSVPAAIWLGEGVGQTGLLIGSILFLIIVEILNSAIEAVVDRVGSERHELSRMAKDMGSAAVLLAAVFPATIWLAVVLGRLGVLNL